MKGLLLKDFYTLAKQMKLFLVMIAVFACLPGYSVSAFAIVYAAMLPISAIAYDERSKWGQLAAMMPYTPRDIVLGKFVLGYAFILAAAALSVGAQTVSAWVRHIPLDAETFAAVGLTACAALVIQSINLPLTFRLGVEKGRIALFLTMALMVGVGAFLGGNVAGGLALGNLDGGAFVAAAVALALLSVLVSVPLSVAIYKKRVLN